MQFNLNTLLLDMTSILLFKILYRFLLYLITPTVQPTGEILSIIFIKNRIIIYNYILDILSLTRAQMADIFN